MCVVCVCVCVYIYIYIYIYIYGIVKYRKESFNTKFYHKMETFLFQCSLYFLYWNSYCFLAMEERAVQRAERRRILAEKKKKQEEEKLVINQECKLRQEKGSV